MSFHSSDNYGSKHSEHDFSVSDFSMESGHLEGVVFEDGIVSICESLYSNLELGEVQDILVSFKLNGPYGFEIPQTELFKLFGTKEGGSVSNSLQMKPHMNEGVVCFDLRKSLNTT